MLLAYGSNRKLGGGVHGNEAMERLCVAEEFPDVLTVNFLMHLQHREALGDFT